MATRKVDRVQRLKDEIIKLPEAEQVKLFGWLEAVRDVRVEDARRATDRKIKLATEVPVADTPKEDSTK